MEESGHGPSLRYYPGTCLEGLTETMKNLVRIVRSWQSFEADASQIQVTNVTA